MIRFLYYIFYYWIVKDMREEREANEQLNNY